MTHKNPWNLAVEGFTGIYVEEEEEEDFSQVLVISG